MERTRFFSSNILFQNFFQYASFQKNFSVWKFSKISPSITAFQKIPPPAQVRMRKILHLWFLHRLIFLKHSGNIAFHFQFCIEWVSYNILMNTAFHFFNSTSTESITTFEWIFFFIFISWVSCSIWMNTIFQFW